MMEKNFNFGPLLTSARNPRLQAVVKLRDRRHREKAGLTVLEGYRELTRGFAAGLEIKECFFCPEMFLGENEEELLAKFARAGVSLFAVPEEILAKMAYRDRPEGLIATAKVRAHQLANLPLVKDGLYLVVEAIEKPGNLGAMLRSADAAGASGLLVCAKRTDLYNPNVIRASTGALFSLPLAECDAVEALTWLRSNGIAIIAATPQAKKIYAETDMSGGVAIVVGAEQYGLGDFWLKHADYQVRIPMLGQSDSLNVATAATILLYEAARQHHWRKS